MGRHSEESTAQAEGLLHGQAVLDDADPVALARECLGEAGTRRVVVDEDKEIDAPEDGVPEMEAEGVGQELALIDQLVLAGTGGPRAGHCRWEREAPSLAKVWRHKTSAQAAHWRVGDAGRLAGAVDPQMSARTRYEGRVPWRALQDVVAEELRGAHLMRFQRDLDAGLAVDIAHGDDRLAGPPAVEILLGEEQAAAKAGRGLGGHCPGGEKGRQSLAELREASVGVADLDAAFGLASQVEHDPEGLEPFTEGLVLLGLGAECPAQEPEDGVDHVGDYQW